MELKRIATSYVRSEAPTCRRFAAAFITAVIVTAMMVVSAPTRAQTPIPSAENSRKNLAMALRAVRPVMRDDPQRAIEMLHSLERQYPHNTQVLNLLGETFQVNSQIDSAIAVYKRCHSANPNDIRSGAALGTLYMKNDQRRMGEAVFTDLITRTKGSINTYRMIGSSLSRNRFYDQALAMYEEGRRVNNGNYILTLDIAHLHRSMGDLSGALEEYTQLINTSPKHQKLARDRILELLRDPRAETDPLLEQLAAAAAVESPYRRSVLEALALAYLECGMIEKALEAALAAEQIGPSDGKVLFSLADKTVAEYRRQPYEEKGRYFDMALRAIDTFITGHPKSPQLPRAKLMLVDLLVDLSAGRVESAGGIALDTAMANALEALDWTIETFPGTDHAEQAYLKKGDVVFRLKKKPEEAAIIYKEGMSTSRFYRTAFAERLGRLYLVIGDYENANRYFSQLIGQKDQELQEAGVFYTGLLLSITGGYESARDTLTTLAEGNPASQFTNDAIRLAWIIEEGLQGDQRILGRYIDALKFEVAEDTTRALAALADIVEKPRETPLRSRALFRTGELYQASEKDDEALAAYEQFIRDYPADTRVPDVHRRIAQVYEVGLGNAALALEKYEDILMSYPHYIFLDEVRADVTRLRNQTGAGDDSS